MKRLLLLAGVVIAAGCGGGGAGGDPETLLRDEDQSRAEMIVFHLEDFPRGWALQPDENANEKSEDECFELDFSDLTINGDADSEDFAAETAFASSTASIFKTEDEARSAFERLVEKDLSSCLADLVEQGVQEGENGVEVKNATSGDLPFSSFGDRSKAYRVRLLIESEGFDVPAVLDIVLMQRERAFAAVVYAAVLDPFPADLEEELTGKVADRMEP